MPDQTARRIYLSFAWASAALVVIMIVGTFGYKSIGGPSTSWLDAFYMTFITIATIGYGEVIDLANSPHGRLFTIFIGFFGIGTLTYMLSTVTAFIVEGDLNLAWRRKRMDKEIGKLVDHYVICGVGRVGSNVAHELERTQRRYVVVEDDMRQIENYLEKYPDRLYVHGDSSDDDMLLLAGIKRARGLFAVTGDDSKNLVISLTAKQLNPNVRVVARVHEVKNMEKTRKAGADAIVSPDFTGSLRIASVMVRPQVVSFLDEMMKSDDNLRVEEIVVAPNFPEQRLGALNLKSRDYIVLAMRDDKHWLFNPDDDQIVRPGRTLVVMATPSGRTKLESELGWI